MNKEEALELLLLDPMAQRAEIEARVRQIDSFFESEQASCLELTSHARSLFRAAYDVLEKEQMQANEKPAANRSVMDATKSFVFPLPKDAAGAPLTEQWWRVYKRAVLIALAFSGLVLYVAPDMVQKLSSVPRPQEPIVEPYQSPYREPATVAPGSPFGEVGPPPDQGGSAAIAEIPPGSQPPQELFAPSEDLNPQPNQNPLVIAPSQSPESFLLAFFSALKDGGNVRSMVKQPQNSSVSQMLEKSHPFCPSLTSMNADTFEILNRSDGVAMVRVKEKYFTGLAETNDYYLVSDNGVWKLEDVQAANGVLP